MLLLLLLLLVLLPLVMLLLLLEGGYPSPAVSTHLHGGAAGSRTVLGTARAWPARAGKDRIG